MRILAMDPGERRVGFALSDELGVTAQGLETFDKRRDGDFFSHVSELVRRYGVDEIVVGHPIHLSGGASESSRRASDMAKKLQMRFDIPVTLWDERLSSEEARRVLRGSRAGKEAVDKLAAVIILQSYLDYRRRDA
jgi:putative Holliday junction resolvase